MNNNIMNNAGIDKIKLILNPLFLNPDYPKHLRPDDALTILQAGDYILLSIHAEYFNPIFDYHITIINAIIEAIQKKVFLFQISTDDIFSLFLTQAFISQYINYFVLGISQVEFCFDFPKGKVAIDKEAVENGDIIQYKDKEGNPTETYYSNDYEAGKRKSSFCVYNKREKLLHDNHHKHDNINDMNIETRIEARLGRDNCPFLDIANLYGTFEDIFKRFQPFLAILYFNHLFGHVEVKGKGNTHFTRLERSARKGKTKYYDRKGLQKYQPIQELSKDEVVISEIKDGVMGNYRRTLRIANNHDGTPVDDTKDDGCSE